MWNRFILLIVLLIPARMIAQADLRQDTLFFEEQVKLYQNWLEETGLGVALRVRELDIEEKSIVLFLEFPFQEQDSIEAVWRFAKNTFDASHPIQLEEQLFYKMINLMEVRQSLAQIAIFDTYDLKEEPSFYREIYFEDGRVQVHGSGGKGPIERAIFFKAKERIEQGNNSAKGSFQVDCTRDRIFSIIDQFAQQHYTQDPCFDRNPQVSVLEKNKVLRLRITDLCRTVLSDAANPILAQVLSFFGKEVNWVKREKLDIQVAYEVNGVDGFTLYINIDGKFGSGMYREVGRGGYYSMSIDFKGYLEEYADIFKNMIYEEIQKECQ